MRFCTLDASNYMRFHTKVHQCGRCHRDRPISMIGLHVFCDSERDARGWVGQKWKKSSARRENAAMYHSVLVEEVYAATSCSCLDIFYNYSVLSIPIPRNGSSYFAVSDTWIIVFIAFFF